MSKTQSKKIKNVFHIVFRVLVFAILSFMVGINIYTWNAKSLLGDALPMPFDYGVAVVLSGSMEPELSVDDLVILKKSDDIKIGDIIVFQSGNSLVIHRVIEKNADTLVTKGDANDTADAQISMDDVKGELVTSIAHIGAITRVTRSPIVVICIIALAVILLELSYKNKKQNDEKELNDLKNQIKKLTESMHENGAVDVEALQKEIERLENEYKK